MDLDDVRRNVQEIRAIAHDDENAHVREDELHQAVLEEIANNTRVPADIRELAKLAISTRDIEFARWCA